MEQLPFALQRKIIDFFLSIPNIHDSNSQRALLYNAGLDTRLQDSIPFGKPPAQFVPSLLSVLMRYGQLDDGRYSLEASLESTKDFIGKDKSEHCDTLIQELCEFRKRNVNGIYKTRFYDVAKKRMECKNRQEIDLANKGRPSPYIVGSPTKPENFYGRTMAVRRFHESVFGRQSQSLSILGIRRSGKTSFLHYVAHPDILAENGVNSDKYLMIYLDMSACSTPERFYKQLSKWLCKSLGLSINTDSGFSDEMDCVESLLSEFPECQFILFLDEFDYIKSDFFDQNFLVQLRALANSPYYDLAYVTASYDKLYNIGTRLGLPKTSPFYNIFHPAPIYMADMEINEAEALVREPAESEEIYFTSDEISYILQIAGTLPFLLQATAEKCFTKKHKNESINEEDILSQLLNEMTSHFDDWWRHFTDQERELLSHLSLQGIVDNSIIEKSNETLRCLKNYGLIIEQEGNFQVNGELFAKWIKLRNVKKFKTYTTNIKGGKSMGILELLTTSTVPVVVKFLFDKMGKLTDRLNEEHLKKIKETQKEVKTLQKAQDIASIQTVMANLLDSLPIDTAVDSKMSFKAWIYEQVTSDYADLPGVGKLLYTILMRAREEETNEGKKDMLLQMATALSSDSIELRGLARIGDDTKEDRRKLHTRIVKAVELL